MAEWNQSEFNGVVYTDPKDELRARGDRAKTIGDTYVAIPIELIGRVLTVKECTATTVVNGDRLNKVLIEIKCRKLVDPRTGKHEGLHVNENNTWSGPYGK